MNSLLILRAVPTVRALTRTALRRPSGVVAAAANSTTQATLRCYHGGQASEAPALRSLMTLQRPSVASAVTTTQSLRYCRGQAGEAPPVLSEKEEALLKIAKPKAEEILAKHHRLPDVAEIPSASLDPTKSQDNLDIRRKRMVYRSKQRGWLEVDLLLGTWAHENVHLLNEAELDEYEAFLNLETIDIYNVITLRIDVPENMKTPDGNGVVERIQAWARASPLGQADPEKYKQVKTASKLI